MALATRHGAVPSMLANCGEKVIVIFGPSASFDILRLPRYVVHRVILRDA